MRASESCESCKPLVPVRAITASHAYGLFWTIRRLSGQTFFNPPLHGQNLIEDVPRRQMIATLSYFATTWPIALRPLPSSPLPSPPFPSPPHPDIFLLILRSVFPFSEIALTVYVSCMICCKDIPVPLIIVEWFYLTQKNSNCDHQQSIQSLPLTITLFTISLCFTISLFLRLFHCLC